MILVKGKDCSTFKSMLSDKELEEIQKVTYSESTKPRSIWFDETRLNPKLIAKVKRLLMIKPEIPTV